MNATVLVERVGKARYRASTSQPIPLQTEGKSQEEAVKRLQKLARKRLAAGALIQISIPGPESNPWQEYAGIWKNHPDFDAFLNNIAEYRQSANRTSSNR